MYAQSFWSVVRTSAFANMRDLLPFIRLPMAITSEVMGRRKFILNSTEMHEWCSYVRSVKHDNPAAVSARVLITPPCMKPCC